MATKKRKAKETNSVVDKARTEHYEQRDDRTPGGRKVFDTGDDVADMLVGKDQAALKQIAVKYGFSDSFNAWVRAGLNFGMIRMNTGNKVRKALRDKEAGKTATKKAKPKAKAKRSKPRVVGGTDAAAASG